MLQTPRETEILHQYTGEQTEERISKQRSKIPLPAQQTGFSVFAE